MKNRFALIIGIAFLVGCDGIQDALPSSPALATGIQVPVAVKSTFEASYPQDPRVEWEYKNGHYVVDFEINGNDIEIWYDAQGNWVRTQTDIPYAQLPEAIKTAHEVSAFATWQVDDVDKMEWPLKETEYWLDVENGSQEKHLVYTLSGVAENPGGNGGSNGDNPGSNGDNPGSNGDNPGSNGDNPGAVPQAVVDAFTAKYPGATGIEWESHNTMYEVEFFLNGYEQEAFFAADGTWQRTKTELTYHSLPQEVKDSFQASVYATWQIDDVTRIEYQNKPTQYILEVERGETEATWTYSISY